jgi:alcohol dehydrogenase
MEFGGPLELSTVPDPAPPDGGVVLAVRATGICRSDWHGWQGHDPDIRTFPHVPGHELAGTVVAVGKAVTRWREDDRVTVPFVCGCGACPECASGNAQVCDRQRQPGFTHWGSFAEYVAIHHADTNLVSLPPEVDNVTAASLGCRFSTAYRAVVAQGRVEAGQWVAVHGCGGLGLSAVMIARALGARVIGIDINEKNLKLAAALGAEVILDARRESDRAATIRERTGRGAHLSLDTLGSVSTCRDSILCLRKRGRHVQVGLLAGGEYQPRLPMEQVIARELELFGSHGMQAARYPELLRLIQAGRLQPRAIVGATIALDQAPRALAQMDRFDQTGMTLIDRF